MKYQLFIASAILLWAGSALAQTVPTIDSPSVCSGCAPTGWTVSTPTPDIVAGNGAWPGGGGWVVSEVSGPSPQGGLMAMMVSNSTLREALASTISGLTVGRDYETCFYYENAAVSFNTSAFRKRRVSYYCRHNHV